MGGTRKSGDTRRPPRGVTVRQHENVSSLQIEFSYRGVRCRESLRMDPTKANIQYAEGLRLEIKRKIANGSFRYIDYFPDSPRARLFGHAVVKTTVGELLRDHLKAYEKAVANSQKSPSTLVGNRKNKNKHQQPQNETTALKV